MKYKEGDVVKLRDDLEVYNKYDVWLRIKGKPLTITEINCGKVYHRGKFISEGITIQSEEGLDYFVDEEMIEGIWEECKGITYEPYEEKTNKYKLIDILNKIANGELKEGTKVKVKGLDGYTNEYKFVKNVEDEPQKYDLQDSNGRYVFDEFYLSALEDEVELIEPEHFTDVGKMAEPTECEHEWKNYTKHRVGEGIIRRFRRCEKCRLEENIEPICEHEWEKYTLGEIGAGSVEIKHRRYCKICGIDEEEPTDNTKIEELDMNEFAQGNAIDYRIAYKLNEVIRYINKENNMNNQPSNDDILKELKTQDSLYLEKILGKIEAFDSQGYGYFTEIIRQNKQILENQEKILKILEGE